MSVRLKKQNRGCRTHFTSINVLRISLVTSGTNMHYDFRFLWTNVESGSLKTNEQRRINNCLHIKFSRFWRVLLGFDCLCSSLVWPLSPPLFGSTLGNMIIPTSNFVVRIWSFGSSSCLMEEQVGYMSSPFIPGLLLSGIK